MADWFFVKNGAQQGPVTIEALAEMGRSGALRPEDAVWTAGMSTWTPAVSVGGIFAAGMAPPPLPAAPIGYATPRRPSQGSSLGNDPGMRWLLPVGRSGWAIAAGYLGLFSVLLVFAPVALIVSIIAIRDIRRRPDRHGMGRAVFGLVMGIIFTIVLLFFVGGIFSARTSIGR